MSKFFTHISMKNAQKIIYRFFCWKKHKIHSEVILSGIYPSGIMRIDSLFRGRACTLYFLTFWLTYTDVCRADAILRPFHRMRRFKPRGDSTSRYRLQKTFKISFNSVIVKLPCIALNLIYCVLPIKPLYEATIGAWLSIM